MEAAARKDRSAPSLLEKDAEKSPNRWQLSSGTDDACGVSELSTHAISSPGVSSEADDAGGLLTTPGNGAGEKSADDEKPKSQTERPAASPGEPSNGVSLFQQVGKIFGFGPADEQKEPSAKDKSD